jgi:cytidylate kinase
MSMIVTVDGLAGVGKDTLADALADVLGYDRLPCGMFFRATGLEVLRQGGNFSDLNAMLGLAEKIIQKYPAFLQDPELQTEAAAQAAPKVAKMREVHDRFIACYRAICAAPPSQRGIVADGRALDDKIPEADIGFCLTADLKKRAFRRYMQLCEKGIQTTQGEVLRAMQERDGIDISVDYLARVPKKSTFIIETTDLTKTEVLARALQHIRSVAPQALP